MISSLHTQAAISIFHVDTREKLISALDKVCDRIQDFTDSAYTSHEHRENILLLCDRAKLELNQLLRTAVNMEQHPNSSFDVDSCVDSVLSAAQDLINQLILTAQDQATDLPHMTKSGIELVNLLRNIALNHEIDRLQNSADRFHEHIDHMLEICKVLRHIAMTESLQVQAKFTEINVRIYGPQVITASKALCSYPSSKAMKENLEVFMDMYQWLITDIAAISKEILDMARTHLKPDKQGYLSLPRPGVRRISWKYFDEDFTLTLSFCPTSSRLVDVQSKLIAKIKSVSFLIWFIFHKETRNDIETSEAIEARHGRTRKDCKEWTRDENGDKRNGRRDWQMEQYNERREQWHCQKGEKHVSDGFLDVSIHERRGKLENDSRFIYTSRVFCWGGESSLQSRSAVFISGKSARSKQRKGRNNKDYMKMFCLGARWSTQKRASRSIG